MNVVENMNEEQYKEYRQVQEALLAGCTISATIGTEVAENNDVFLLPDKTVTGEVKPSITVWNGYIYFTMPLPDALVTQFVAMHDDARGAGKLISISFISYDDLTGVTDTMTCINPPAVYRKAEGLLCVANRFAQILYEHTTLDAMEVENELDYEAEEAAALARAEEEKEARRKEEAEALGWLTDIEDEFDPLA